MLMLTILMVGGKENPRCAFIKTNYISLKVIKQLKRSPKLVICFLISDLLYYKSLTIDLNQYSLDWLQFLDSPIHRKTGSINPGERSFYACLSNLSWVLNSMTDFLIKLFASRRLLILPSYLISSLKSYYFSEGGLQWFQSMQKTGCRYTWTKP